MLLLLYTAIAAVHQADIFDLLPKVEADMANFDPPYGFNNEKMSLWKR